MLTLAPLKNSAEIEKFYLEKGFVFGEFSGCLLCKDETEILGLCLYELTNEQITVNFIEPLENYALADGILRSTLHVAAEQSVMNAFYGEKVAEFVALDGFVKDPKEKSLNIDKLFQSCGSCGK